MVVNKIYGRVTLPGIAMTWGLTVMVIVYFIGHVSSAHLNPYVTITFSMVSHFPYPQVTPFSFSSTLQSISHF